jgi:hypothetical protein
VSAVPLHPSVFSVRSLLHYDSNNKIPGQLIKFLVWWVNRLDVYLTQTDLALAFPRVLSSEFLKPDRGWRALGESNPSCKIENLES